MGLRRKSVPISDPIDNIYSPLICYLYTEELYMEAKANLTLDPKEITGKMVADYFNLTQVLKELEKKKEEMRKAMLKSYPQGGEFEAIEARDDKRVVIKYLLIIDKQPRRSFPLDDVKASVEDTIWIKFYEPFVKITEVERLSVKRFGE